jgi:regulator of protease activity HflC (stomatin/prohibitin superfamily)
MKALIVVLVVVVLLVLLGLAMALRIVKQYERGVPFRLGQKAASEKAAADRALPPVSGIPAPRPAVNGAS